MFQLASVHSTKDIHITGNTQSIAEQHPDPGKYSTSWGTVSGNFSFGSADLLKYFRVG